MKTIPVLCFLLLLRLHEIEVHAFTFQPRPQWSVGDWAAGKFRTNPELHHNSYTRHRRSPPLLGCQNDGKGVSDISSDKCSVSIGSGSYLNLEGCGDFPFAKQLIVDGTLIGNLKCLGDQNDENTFVAVGEGGELRSDVSCTHTVKVYGRLVGNVNCNNLFLGPKAVLIGNAVVEKISVEDGASISGTIQCGTIHEKDMSVEVDPVDDCDVKIKEIVEENFLNNGLNVNGSKASSKDQSSSVDKAVAGDEHLIGHSIIHNGHHESHLSGLNGDTAVAYKSDLQVDDFGHPLYFNMNEISQSDDKEEIVDKNSLINGIKVNGSSKAHNVVTRDGHEIAHDMTHNGQRELKKMDTHLSERNDDDTLSGESDGSGLQVDDFGHPLYYNMHESGQSVHKNIFDTSSVTTEAQESEDDEEISTPPNAILDDFGNILGYEKVHADGGSNTVTNSEENKSTLQKDDFGHPLYYNMNESGMTTAKNVYDASSRKRSSHIEEEAEEENTPPPNAILDDFGNILCYAKDTTGETGKVSSKVVARTEDDISRLANGSFSRKIDRKKPVLSSKSLPNNKIGSNTFGYERHLHPDDRSATRKTPPNINNVHSPAAPGKLQVRSPVTPNKVPNQYLPLKRESKPNHFTETRDVKPSQGLGQRDNTSGQNHDRKLRPSSEAKDSFGNPLLGVGSDHSQIASFKKSRELSKETQSYLNKHREAEERASRLSDDYKTATGMTDAKVTNGKKHNISLQKIKNCARKKAEDKSIPDFLKLKD